MNEELRRERCGGLFIQIDHLLDLLASSEGWEQCPHWVASHFAWEPHTIPLHVRLEWVRPYHDEVARICGCDPDNGGRGCYNTYRECWAKFIEQAPEWWWNVLTDRPRVEQPEEPPTLF